MGREGLGQPPTGQKAPEKEGEDSPSHPAKAAEAGAQRPAAQKALQRLSLFLLQLKLGET